MGTILVPLFAHCRPAHRADRRHHIDRFAGGLRHQPRRMESGSDDRADARIPLHEDQRKIAQGHDAADVPIRQPLVPIHLTDEVSVSGEPLSGGRYFRQVSARCKATVWESRSPKISLASSTPRN